MQMYSLLEQISNYFDTTGSLWFYSKDEPNEFNVHFENNAIFTSFKCKAKLMGSIAAANGILENATITVQLKHFNCYFWRLLDVPLISCKVEFKH